MVKSSITSIPIIIATAIRVGIKSTILALLLAGSLTFWISIVFKESSSCLSDPAYICSLSLILASLAALCFPFVTRIKPAKHPLKKASAIKPLTAFTNRVNFYWASGMSLMLSTASSPIGKSFCNMLLTYTRVTAMELFIKW